MTAALNDDSHAEAQRARYAARRARLRPGTGGGRLAGRTSGAGLYLWAARPGYDCRASVDVLAGAGILVAPGEIYGPAGGRAHPGGADRDRRADRRRRAPAAAELA